MAEAMDQSDDWGLGVGRNNLGPGGIVYSHIGAIGGSTTRTFGVEICSSEVW